MNDITMPDVLFFLRAWTSDPLRVAAIAPSGPALAELITREITPECGSVLELGPGTGVFTRALLARGVRAEDLTLVENSADFAELLRIRFPKARVLRMNAARLYRHHLFDDAPVGAVVSGLPLLSMRPKSGAHRSRRSLWRPSPRRRVLSVYLWSGLPSAEAFP